MNAKNNFRRIAENNNKIYSQRATVIQTYSRKQQSLLFQQGELNEEYNADLHLKCDVRTDDGTSVYGVYLSPHILARDSNNNILETVYDGSVESPSGDIPVDIPIIGSFVFISWLDDNTAFVAMQSRSQNVTVGSTSGAYFDFYTQEDIRILDLVNADEFNIDFNNGYSFSLRTDNVTDLTRFIMLMETIIMNVPGAELFIGKDSDDNPVIKFEVENGGKISIKNNVENLKTILEDLIQAFIDYQNIVQNGLITADLSLSASLTQLLSNLNKLKKRVSNLLK